MKNLLIALPAALSLTVSSSFSFATTEQDKKDASQLYEKALEAFETGSPEVSFIHLKNALKTDPSYLSAKLLLGKLFFSQGNHYAAEKTYEEALAMGADVNRVLPLYGSALILQRKPDSVLALEKYSNKLSHDALFEWLLLKGQAQLIKHDATAAKRTLEKASAMRPQNARGLNILASYHLRVNELETASKLADQSLETDPSNERTWQLKGEIATKKGDINAAFENFSRGYEIDPEDPILLRKMAKVQLERSEPQEAKKYLEKILEQTPNDPHATLLHSIILLGQGEKDLGNQMLADLSSKLSVSETSEEQEAQAALFVKATTEYIQGNLEKARTLLGNYLLNSPGDLAAIRMLTDLHLKNGSKRQALLLLESQQKYIAGDFALTGLLANLYIDEKKLFTAEQELQKLQAILPGHPYVTMLQADILNAQGYPKKALALMEQHSFETVAPLPYALKRGRLEIETGRLTEALRTGEQMLALYPEDIRVLNYAAALNLKTGNLKDAKNQLNRALNIAPQNLTARFNKALSVKMEGRIDQATSLAKDILNDSPEHIQAILLIANIRAEEGNLEEALEWLEKISAYDRNHIASNELKLDIHARREELKKAVSIAQHLYKNSANSARYLFREAELHIAQENYDAAQKPLFLLFSLWEKQPQKLRRLADLQIRAMNLKAARKSLEKALSLDNESLSVHLDLARLSLREGDLEGTEQAVHQLTNRFGNHSYIELLAADLANDREQHELARQHYTQAFTLDKNNSKALLMLYQLTLRGIGDSAFTSLVEQERQKGPIPPWAHKLLADSYLNQGQLEQAQARYEELLSKASLSDNGAILNNLANIYAKTDLDKALTTAKRALDSNKRNPSLLDTIGWIYLEKDMPTDALFYLREASALDSSNPEIRYHQGLALIKLERAEEAKREFRAALRLSDNFPGSREAARWLDKLGQ